MDPKIISNGHSRPPAPAPQGEGSLGQRIRGEIEGRILSGEWGPGHRIPFEHELTQQYGCARMTVSKALASLAEAGLIERRRRAGTFVRRPTEQSAVLTIPDIRAEVLDHGKAYRHEITSARTRAASASDMKLLGLDAPEPVLVLTCRHFADNEPCAFEERLIVLSNVPEASAAVFEAEPPGTWMLNHIPWHEAENRISALAAEPRIAGKLGCETGAACLVVERRTWQFRNILTHVRVWYPGERQSLVARFTPALAVSGR